MSYDNWLSDSYVRKWLGKKSKKTQKNYVSFFPSWLAFIKMTPTQQIQRRVEDLKGDIQKRSWFEDKVIEYKQLLEAQFDNETTIKAYLTCVRSFFSSNRLPLTFGKGELSVEVASKVITKEWIPANEEIRVMYSQASPRDRALLLVLYQSGFSEIDVSALNIEHLGDIYNMDVNEHYYIMKKREKTNIIQATCISVEALHDIRAMLRERGNPKEGALFVSPKGGRLSVRFINEAMKRLAEKAYPERPFKTKSLRSSYNASLLQADLKSEIKDLMFGHKRLGARGHYAFNEQTIKASYEKAFRYLSINHGVQARQDLQKIENSLIGLSETVVKQRKQITQLNDALMLIYEKIARIDKELAEDIRLEIEKANHPIILRIQRIERTLIAKGILEKEES